MTTAELRKKIAEKAADLNWFESKSEIFNFSCIGFRKEFIGVSAIYEFVNQQLNGLNKFEDNIPDVVRSSKNYFHNIKEGIINFVNSHVGQTPNNLESYWGQIRNSISNSNTYPSQPFTYNSPEIIFLVGINKDYPNYYQGAYDFIVSNIQYQRLPEKNYYIGCGLAYEYVLKDNSKMTERRDSEKASMSKIRSDFHSYLTESEKDLTEHISNITRKYTEYSTIIDKIKEEKETSFNAWFNEAKKTYDEFSTGADERLVELQTTYEELLRLKKPADYWKTRATELKTEGKNFLRWLVGLVIFACAILYSLLWLTPEGMLKSFFSEDKGLALRWSIIFVTLISFIAYGIRALSKITFSSFHLARDAEERERLTYVYLAMVKDASVDKEDRHLIMQSLFSRADTGLLKDDSSPTMPNDLLNKFFSK